MNADELARRAHQEWLGYVQPSGLVVSPPALIAAQAFPQKNIVPEQQRLIELVGDTDPETILDFPRFTREFLGWEARDLAVRRQRGSDVVGERPTQGGATRLHETYPSPVRNKH